MASADLSARILKGMEMLDARPVKCCRDPRSCLECPAGFDKENRSALADLCRYRRLLETLVIELKRNGGTPPDGW